MDKMCQEQLILYDHSEVCGQTGNVSEEVYKC
jgi:hypothetical protein